MKHKLLFSFYIITLLVMIIVFVAVGKYVWCDCLAILESGYTEEIGLGMGLVIFYGLGFFIPGTIVEFFKFCKSSGSPDDK